MSRRDRCLEHGIQYFWVDTCCIDRSNDAELRAAIRSMFDWYSEADVCFVYLSDVRSKGHYDAEGGWLSAFMDSRWFRRGWTLQELLAPTKLEFYTSSGEALGNKDSHCDLIADVTNIPRRAIKGRWRHYAHCDRLKWIEGRETKRTEDLVYCLSGICDVSMDACYGEGYDRAWSRLKSEIQLYHPQESLRDESQEQRNLINCFKYKDMDLTREDIEDPHAMTCGWVESHDGYVAWRGQVLAAAHHGVLWIKGKPGMGKSVLLKYLVTLVRSEAAEGVLYLAHYFNSRGDPLEKTLSGLYRSFLFQIFTHDNELLELLDDVDMTSVFDSKRIRSLLGLLGKVLLQVKCKAIYLFIDALDECVEDVYPMIDFFSKMRKDMSSDGPSLLTCYTSRHYPTFEILNAIQIELETTKGHEQDLINYIRHEVQTGDSAETQKLQSDIIAKANGIFLYAILLKKVIEGLRRTGCNHAIEEQLQHTPQGLSDLFGLILAQNTSEMRETILALRLILFSAKPLTLVEFYFAMMSDIAPSKSQKYNGCSPKDAQMLLYMKHTSRGLAELVDRRPSTSKSSGRIVEQSSRPIRLIHETVRHYLLSEESSRLTGQFSLQSRENAHEVLKHRCLAVLQSVEPSDQDGSPRVFTKYPFLTYAVQSILYHADVAASTISQTEFVKGFDWNTWHCNYKLLQRSTVAEPGTTTSTDPVHVCAHLGFANLVSTLARQNYKLTQKNASTGTTPFIEAIARGHKLAARTLLSLTGCNDSAIVCDQAFSIDNFYTCGWQQAIDSHLDELALYMILVDETIDLDQGKIEVITYVASTGRLELLQQLLSEVWHLTIDSQPCKSALDAGIKSAQAAVVKGLVDAGMDTKLTNDAARTPLIEAIFLGSTSVVAVLINEDNVNIADGEGQTALLHACLWARWDVIEPLLAAGADTSICDRDGFGPLLLACSRGHLETVNALLQSGASTDTVSGTNCTPLGYAAENGDISILRALLEHGANVDAIHRNGKSPLNHAVDKGRTSAVELLLEYVAAHDGTEQDILAAATAREYRFEATESRPLDPGD